MTDTRKQIIDLGEHLIRTIGFNAFSYKDIAVPLQIKNAAIHYYFPSKTDLGVAVIHEKMEEMRKFAVQNAGLSEDEQLKKYLLTFKHSQKKGWVCLMGTLSACYDSLPPEMQKATTEMGNEIFEWLTACLANGRKKKIFTFKETPAVKARLIQSNFLAALLLSKAVGDNVAQSIYTAVMQSV